MAVRGRIDDGFGGKVAANARAVIDDKFLTGSFRQRASKHPRDHVGRTAGGEPDQDAHRARRVGCRPCEM